MLASEILSIIFHRVVPREKTQMDSLRKKDLKDDKDSLFNVKNPFKFLDFK